MTTAFYLLKILSISLLGIFFIATLDILVFALFCVAINIFFFSPKVTIDPIDLLLSEEAFA